MTPQPSIDPIDQISPSRWWHRIPVAWAVLVLTSSLTMAAWWISEQFSTHLAKARFERHLASIETLIQTRMKAYEQVLVGGVALMRVKPNTTREDWKIYVERLRLKESFPGIQGMGFAVPVAAEERAAHIAKIRSEGFPDYTIRPETERAEYTAIIFLEPFDWRNQRAFGYDMWSNDMRRMAMRRARDEGHAVSSGIITLVQETDEAVQRGFLCYQPLYDPAAEITTVQQRRDAFVGWVYAAFRTGDLMNGILGPGDRGYEFEVYDNNLVGAEGLLFDSDPQDTLFDQKRKPEHSSLIQSTITGRNWLIYVHSTSQFLSRAEAWAPKVVAAGGGLIVLLVLLVAISLRTVQVKARKLAKEMTQKLQDQTTELEERNAELLEFAYIASHDLQEPIRTIHTSAGILIKRSPPELDESNQRLLSFIEQSSNRMNGLVKGLLDYSRLGRTEAAEQIDVSHVIQEIRIDLDAVIKEKSATLEVGNLPVIGGYPGEVRMLFQNLIANALNYQNPEVTPRIEVGASQQDGKWVFFVRDNGIGIESKHFGRIFKIFQRLHLKSEYSGTGIGLAKCKKIVELHGGRIWVESVPGEGSTFLFTLPSPRKIEKTEN